MEDEPIEHSCQLDIMDDDDDDDQFQDACDLVEALIF